MSKSDKACWIAIIVIAAAMALYFARREVDCRDHGGVVVRIFLGGYECAVLAKPLGKR
jgi:hypothetical protein